MAAGLAGCGAGVPLWLCEGRAGCSRGQGRGQMGANLVGKGAGGRQRLYLVGLAWALQPWMLFKAAPVLLADRRLFPKAAVGCALPNAPLVLKVFPRHGLAKVVGFPAGLL